MTKRTVLVGVDATDVSAAAAKIGWDVADATGDKCQLVHVTADVSKMPATVPPIEHLDEWIKRVQSAARRDVKKALRGYVPNRLIDELEVRMGRAAWVMPSIIDEFDATLLVLGRKRHPGPVRWFGGSTVHHLVRTVDVPMLVVDAVTTDFQRILVAVDSSHAAQTVLDGAMGFANRCNAEIRVINVVEPVPYLGEFPAPLDDAGYAKWAGDRFRDFMDTPSWRDLDQISRHGPATSTILDEAESWDADLIVAGTHGAGWLDRVLVGSTTQRLLNRWPKSLYIVPVGPPAGAKGEQRDTAVEAIGR